MDKVFISYSRKNQNFAERIARDLADAGLDVWFDLRQIQGGEFWRDEIQRGLLRSELLVLCLSPDALASEWVYKEVQAVKEAGKKVFPAMLEDSLAEIETSDRWKWLSDVQFIQFEDRYEEAFRELLQALPGGRAIGTYDVFDPETIPNPFKGLEAFQQRDASFFFGRDDLIQKAITRLKKVGFLSVVGASGSGKSSLVRAGVIPALRKGALKGSANSPYLIMMPGDKPLEAMASRLSPLFPEGIDVTAEMLEKDPQALIPLINESLMDDEAQIYLIIDQFEEIFTRAPEGQRVRFLGLLTQFATEAAFRIRVILTMRSDFFGNLSSYPQIIPYFEQDHLLIVGKMTTANLLRAMTDPAKAVGLKYEAGLVDQILEDLGDEPGSLPLLQYCLQELFKRRDKIYLTRKAYEDIGGVKRALAQHAEAIYSSLSESQQELTRRVMLRLVEVSEGGEPTRRKVSREEIQFKDIKPEAIDAIIERLTANDARLLVANREIANKERPITWLQVGHEALIREWDRFKSWVSASMENLIYESELRKLAADWKNNSLDSAYLLRGRRLIRAELWLEGNIETTDQERTFIEASLKSNEANLKAERERAERELDLQKRATRQLRWIAASLVVFLIFVIVGVFFVLNINSDLSTAINQASSLAISASARQAYSEGDFDLAIALAIEANQIQEAPEESQRALSDIAYAPGTRRFSLLENRVSSLAYSTDESRFAFADRGGNLRVYDAASESEIFSQTTSGTVTSIAMNADGKKLLVAEGALQGISRSAKVSLWDVDSGELTNLSSYSNEKNTLTVAFSNDGQVALYGGTGSVHGWDIRNEGGALTDLILTNPDAIVTVLQTTPIDAHIIAGDNTGTITLFDFLSNTSLWEYSVGTTDSVTALATVPNSEEIVVGMKSGLITILDARDGTLKRQLFSLDSEIVLIEFISKTDNFVVVTKEGDISVWYVKNGTQISRFRTGEFVFDADLSNDGYQITTGSSNSIRVWDYRGSTETSRMVGQGRAIEDIATDPENKVLASTDGLNNVFVWNMDTSEVEAKFKLNGVRRIGAIIVDPAGENVLAGTTSGQIWSFNIETEMLEPYAELEGDEILAMALSPDNSQLVLGTKAGEMIILETTQHRESWRQIIGSRQINVLEFSPDGSKLLSGDESGKVIVWDMSNAYGPTQGSVFDLHSQAVRSLAIRDDLKQLLVGFASGHVSILNLETGKEKGYFLLHNERAISGLAYATDDAFAVSAGEDGTLRTWQISDGFVVRLFEVINERGRSTGVADLILLKDRNRAFTAVSDGTIRSWLVTPKRDDLIDWTFKNRFVRELSCPERLFYRVPLEEGQCLIEAAS